MGDNDYGNNTAEVAQLGQSAEEYALLNILGQIQACISGTALTIESGELYEAARKFGLNVTRDCQGAVFSSRSIMCQGLYDIPNSGLLEYNATSQKIASAFEKKYCDLIFKSAWDDIPFVILGLFLIVVFLALSSALCTYAPTIKRACNERLSGCWARLQAHRAERSGACQAADDEAQPLNSPTDSSTTYRTTSHV